MSQFGLSRYSLPLAELIPREPQPVETWVPENVYLDERVAATPGYFSLIRFPYFRRAMDKILSPFVEQASMSFGTQMGKTTTLGAIICWIAENDPANCLIVVDSEDAAEEHYLTKLEPYLESVPAIRKRMLPKERRSRTIVNLRNMWIYYAWPRVPRTLSGRTCKYILVTELNLITVGPRGEGNWLNMAKDRGKAFPGSKLIVEGKPTIEGMCQLEAMEKESLSFRYQVPCPTCGKYQEVVKQNATRQHGLIWEHDQPPRLKCEHCPELIDESQKLIMLQRGLWVPQGCTVSKQGELIGKPAKSETKIHFAASSLYSTSKAATWRKFADEWDSAKSKRSKSALQAVVNSWLNETWKIKSVANDGDVLDDHKDEYEIGSIPELPLQILAAADVQQNGFYWVIRAFGYSGSSWLVRYGFSTSQAQLLAAMKLPIHLVNGSIGRVKQLMVDGSNDFAEMCKLSIEQGERVQVVRFDHQSQYSQVAPIKVIGHSKLGTNQSGKMRSYWNIDAGLVRDMMFDDRLRIKRGSPGYWSIPKKVTADYEQAIKAWERRPKDPNNVDGEKVWVSNSPTYEHWGDCEAMLEAACYVYQFDHIHRPMKGQPAEPNASNAPVAWDDHGVEQPILWGKSKPFG